jgi:predicted molibdopterin-dependent oxidoreductase YjgC
MARRDGGGGMATDETAWLRAADEVDAPALVEVTIDGRVVRLPDGEMLAASLLAAGYAVLNGSIVQGAPRGPFCLMGSCCQCVAEIDGVPQVRTCRVAVRAGMRVRRMMDASPVRPPDAVA